MTNTPGDDDVQPQPDQPGYWEQQSQQGQPQPPQSPYGPPYAQQPYAQQPYQQQPYQQQPYPQQPYGQPAYGQQPYYQGRPNHPNATTSMVLGIVGLVLGMSCGVGFLASPFAWVLGAKAVREIDAAPHAYDGRGQAQAGKILGIVGTVLLVLALLALVLLIAVGVSGGFDSDPTIYDGA